jgi:hypothetical protein
MLPGPALISPGPGMLQAASAPQGPAMQMNTGQTAANDRTWAHDELERVAALLGHHWRVWYVETPYSPVSAFQWSARPKGARIATCSASAPDELVEAVREYVADLTLHVADARAELEAIPPSEPGRYQVVRDLICALEALTGEAA